MLCVIIVIMRMLTWLHSQSNKTFQVPKIRYKVGFRRWIIVAVNMFTQKKTGWACGES